MWYTASTDDYVYDYYTVKDEIDMADVDASPFPLLVPRVSLYLLSSLHSFAGIANWLCFRVQVDEEDDFYDGPDDTEYETDDSNGGHEILLFILNTSFPNKLYFKYLT